MRWDELFDDLAAQWEAEVRRELDAEVADRTRRERGVIGLYERLAVGARAAVTLRVGGRIEGRVADVGDGWLLVLTQQGPAALVPFAGIASVVSASPRAVGMPVGRRFGLGYALRGLSRDRSVVTLTDTSGGLATGTIDAVGRDVLELSEHPADLPRRPQHVTGTKLVPFGAIVALRQA
ncbi:hypothetical protein [Pedococcus sp. 5OH_020]|uniref:hypothetical protein n=1 Tax=Pedococcus sp. 5OH_020 TaxID=2989814 RepID=UPI0022E9C5B4|nr:hypothetical protein [Pedococcus sp. 5OH_020]